MNEYWFSKDRKEAIISLKTTPGLKRSADEQLWLLQAEQKWSKESQPNRMVRLYGPREGHHCKECRFLLRKVLRSGRVFFKCMFVGNTGGPGTDFRAGWDACSKFVPRLQREGTTAGNRVMFCP